MKKYLIVLISASFLLSCAKETVKAPEFEVTVNNNTFKIGDPVNFHFTGNPELITFYSGVFGSRYDYKDVANKVGNTIMKFTTRGEFLGVNSKLELLFSKNFVTPTDSAHVKNATWVNITDRVALSTGAAVDFPSGDIKINDLANVGDKLTFAFRFTGKSTASPVIRQSTWTIKDISINNILPDTTYNLVNMAANLWGKYSYSNSTNIWTNTAAQLKITGGNQLAADNDDWIVSKTFDPFFSKTETGVAIKDFGSTMTDYSFTYHKAGTYKVVFVGNVVRTDNAFPIVKEITINIIPN